MYMCRYAIGLWYTKAAVYCQLPINSYIYTNEPTYFVRWGNLQSVKHWKVQVGHSQANKSFGQHYHGVLRSIHVHFSWQSQNWNARNVTVEKHHRIRITYLGLITGSSKLLRVRNRNVFVGTYAE